MSHHEKVIKIFPATARQRGIHGHSTAAADAEQILAADVGQDMRSFEVLGWAG